MYLGGAVDEGKMEQGKHAINEALHSKWAASRIPPEVASEALDDFVANHVVRHFTSIERVLPTGDCSVSEHWAST